MPVIPELSPSMEALHQAFEALFAAQRRLRGRDSKLVDGISLAQFRLLQTLDREGALPAGRAAALAGIVPASATQMFDVLEDRLLVKRERSLEDRRVVTVTLTDAGSMHVQHSRARHREVFENALGDLGPDEAATGTDVLRRCAAYLDAL